MKTTTEQMDASQVFCPNLDCVARGHIGQGTIVSHGKARARYRCKSCGKTFSAQVGTMFEGLRKPKTLIVIVVSLTRDRRLADRLLRHVRACCQPMCALLVCTDGWNAYPGSIRRAFREKVKEIVGRGRACLRVWPQLCIAVVIKRTEKKRVVEITRKMVQGTLAQAQALLSASDGGTVLNTAFIERLNGTIRQRLASLTRKCRHAARRLAALESGMWLLGCTYNLCWPHHELSRRAAKAQGVRGEVPVTPAMASGLTDHVWSVKELLSYRVAPAPWVAPKRRGRPAKQTELHESLQQSSGEQVRRRPLLRLRKGVLCSTTS